MTKTIRSFTSDTQYFCEIDEHTGLMTNCFCPDRQFRHKPECKHQREFNEQMRKQVAFQQAWHALDFRSEAQQAARREAYCVINAIYG